MVQTLESRELLAATQAWLFDFGGSGPDAAGAFAANRVSYTSAIGHGWIDKIASSGENGGPIPLLSGWNGGTNSSFRVDLPDGTYLVQADFGDEKGASSDVVSSGGHLMTSGSTTAGQFIDPTFQSTVTNGEMTLKFTNKGSSNDFKLDGLQITLVMPTATIVGVPATAPEGSPIDLTGSATEPNPSVPIAPTLANSGFESPALRTGNFLYNPTGAGWTFSGSSGISNNSSGFTSGNPPAPAGTQVAFVQATGSISQSIANWQAGTYSVSLQAAQRANYGGFQEDFEILVDGNPVSSFLPQSKNYQSFSTSSFVVGAGTHTVTIQGLDTAGGDNTAFLDSVSIVPSATQGTTNFAYAWSVTKNGGPFATGTGANIVFTPDDNATYQVSLTATDPQGQVSTPATTSIVVTNVAPTASIGGSYSATIGQGVTFSASATDPSSVDTATGFTYAWNFGDGSAVTSGLGLAKPQHTYTSAGSYTVVVTATDKDGGTSLPATTNVVVASPPPTATIVGVPATAPEGSPIDLTGSATEPNPSVPIAPTLANSGFESPALRTGNFLYNPTGAGWTFSGSSGISNNSSGFTSGNPPAPAGTQVAFVQATGSISQSIANWQAGTYSVSLQAAQRANYGGFQEDFEILVDGNPVSSFLPQSKNYQSFSTSSFVVGAGTHTVTIQGLDTAGGDNTAFLDSVSIVPSATQGTTNFAYAWSVTKNGGPFATGTGANIVFTPDDNATYQVSLTATDPQGQVSTPATTSIVVTNVAPTASIGGSYSATIGQGVTFSASATDPSSVDTATGFTYAWNFGDGSAVTSGLGLAKPQHTYTSAGSYTVVVTATDKDGGTSLPATTNVVVASPPPTATGADLGNEQLTPGWATFGEVLAEGEASGSLQLGNLATQTDIKNLWPDGSIKYAILTTYVTASGTYPVTQAASSTGSFAPKIPNTSVQFTIGGVPYQANLPQSVSTDLWLNGPLVKEWRWTVAPVDSSGNPNPTLRVIFDTRSYNNGQMKSDVTVENDLDVVGATAMTYDVSITANNQTLFSQAGVTQSYLTRWYKEFDLGLTESQVTHDFQSFYDAGALPQFLSTVTNQDYSTSGPNFGILGQGDNSYQYMGSTGGRPELAPYPAWVAQYLTYQTTDQFNELVDNGELAGSWPIHVREPDSSLVSIDNEPNFWLDPRGQQYQPSNQDPQGDLSAASLGPLTPDLAHVPSLSYVPYLVTGTRYLADEMGFWGNDALISSWSASLSAGGRGGSQGIVGTEQVRARAWGLRNLVDAAAYLPDSDPAKGYLSSKVENNLNYYDNYAQTHVTTLGTVLESQSGNNLVISQWQNNYLAWSLEHADQQGFTGGQIMANQIAAFQLKLFTSAPAYPEAYAAPYYPVVGQVEPDGTFQYFTTMSQVFQATNQNADGSVSPPVPFAGYYGVDARLSLMIAIDQGWAGAQDAYNWLLPQILSDLNSRSGWAIAQPKSSKSS